MKISLNWIKEFVDIPPKHSARELAELLTLRTCEVEGFEDEALKFANMAVGKVVAMRAHPNADKLKLADTDIGGRTVQIVCGGKNLEEGMIVAVALPGAVVNWHGTGESVELKETKIRGEASFGMICAGEEIGLPKSPPEGITDLGHLCEQRGLALPKPGTALAAALKLNDVIFEIDNKSITHRPDLWGHYGMAREFAAILGKKLRPFVNKVAPSRRNIGLASLRLGLHVKNPPKKGERVSVKIEKTNIAARFLTAIITGIKVGPSPSFLQNRLRAVGMRPVNNIVDITNYVMLELGHPLHAFERRVVENDAFVIRFAKQGEVMETLDHKKRALHAEDALVTNGERVLGIAGVMGGLNSEITPKTSEIVLEVAAWNSLLIRKTSTRHLLKSDAAQRFEKSLDPEYSGFAFHRACELVLQLCPGAALAGPATDLYPAKQRVRKLHTVTLDAKTVGSKIGVPMTTKEMERHLSALEFGVSLRGARRGARRSKLDKLPNDIIVTIPTFRATKDINMEDDLVEEIARMYGYEKIPPKLPALPIRLPRVNHERDLKHRARRILSFGLGFSEVNLYSFYGMPEIRNALLPIPAHLEIENPLTADQTHLRISLLPNMLKAAALDLYHHDAFKIYEVGRTYIKGAQYFPVEEKFICGLVVESATLREPQGDNKIFYSALGALQAFFQQFRSKFSVTASQTPPPYAHPSKCASIKMQNEEVAAVFEVHPQVLKNFGIKIPTAAFELNFTRFAALHQPDISYKPLPRFPGIELDVSVLVQKRTPVREIQELIRRTDQSLIAKISLIDIFEDKSLGEGKKSFTFRVLLQSPDRTLTDDEMKQVQEKIFSTMRSAGFAIR